jgi:hypothetical protein
MGLVEQNEWEMGGYLPLELPAGKSYFSDLDPELVLEVNTGRTALRYAIESLEVRHVLLPYFYCPDIIQMLRTLDVTLEFYHIGPDLLPVQVDCGPETAIILVNYYGIIGQRLQSLTERFSKVILDQAHGFYEPPVLRKGVMNVYSCRKFFGVCDGAYLVGQGICHPAMEEDISYPRAVHLLKCFETGTNGAYAESKANEAAIGAKPLAMSRLTRRILEGVDYAAVAERRNRNFRFLQQQFSHIQQLQLTDLQVVPYAYPLLLDQDIHTALVKEKIYTPVLWSQLLDPEWAGTLEQHYSAFLHPLPLDQRYEETQLQRMVQIVKDILKRQQ